MAIRLTPAQVENIKKYKYATNDWTPLDLAFNPWWEFVTNSLSKRIAPNLITLCGAIGPLAAFGWLCYHDLTLSAVLPASVCILNALAIFWFTTLDAVDGKQARRTDNCSPLGQILDHNLDQFSHVFFCISACAVLRLESRYWAIFMVVNGQVLPHYTIEYRKHFTNFHATVVEAVGGIQVGVTETSTFSIIIQLIFAFLPTRNESCSYVVFEQSKWGVEIQLGDLIAFSTFVLSVQYNLGNFKEGVASSKELGHTLACFLPFFQIPFILYLASVFSNFWEDYVVLFLFGVGMLITNMTGSLNLASTAGFKFNPHYWDPYVFIVVLAVDYNQVFDKSVVAGFYISMVAIRIALYLSFMRSVADQICDNLDIPFLTVKQGFRSRKTGKIYD